MNRSRVIIFCSLLTAVFAGGILLLLGVSQTAVQAAPNATWYVSSSSGNDGNDCQSLATACATIGAAVGKAGNNDTIEISAGTYNEHDIQIFKPLTLNGAGAGITIVDAGGNGRLFHTGSTITIYGMTLLNGQTAVAGNIFETGGGAVLNSGGGTLTLQNVDIVYNEASGSGGGIFNVATLILDGTKVISNTAGGGGGGIYNYNIGVITVTQSTLALNIANASGAGGGAIYHGGNSLSVTDSNLAQNQSNYFGGGLHVDSNSSIVLENITLADNQSSAGAGLAITTGAVTMTNGTVSGNTASNNYGGIYATGPSSSIFIQNSTIAENTRTNTAGNGFNGVMRGNNATISLVNTILANNQQNNCSSFSPPTSLGHNLSSDNTCGLTQTGDQPGVDPLLGSLANNGGIVITHALLPGSPAIDAGDNAQCPAKDARRIDRPYDGDGDSTATCDIGAVEARHQITIADTAVLEGDSGSVTAVFTVTLSPASVASVSVNYHTMEDSASAGSDFTDVNDVLTFTPGQMEKTIAVSVTGDTNDEQDETFFVLLNNPVNADLIDDQATGTIIDDDGLPALSIGDESILEGNSGTKSLEFEVTLSPASASVVSVDYDTVDGTASASSDYGTAGDTLTFQPGETSKTISIDIQGDIVDEGISEAFTIQLSSPSNAALADGEATGTITDDDEARLSHNIGPQVLEGNSGTTPAVFTVTLSTPADFTVMVDYEVSSGYGTDGAKVGDDFQAAADTLTFLPGETIKTYTVQIIGDTISENNEHYSSLISNANVPITVNGSQATILNDDGFFIYLPMIIR